MHQQRKASVLSKDQNPMDLSPENHAHSKYHGDPVQGIESPLPFRNNY